MISVLSDLRSPKYSISLRTLLLIGSATTLSALLMIAWTFLNRIANGRAPFDGISPFYWEMPNAYLWILLFPFIYFIVRRNPIHRNTHILKLISIHVFFALCFAATHLTINILVSSSLFQSAGIAFEETNPWCPYSSALRMSWRVLFYAALVAVCYGAIFFDQIRRNKLKNSKLEARLRTARLNQMKIRIDSAFVHRTLSRVGTLMQTNRAAAMETITRLAAFFRMIQKQDEPLTLLDHIQLLRSYFKVERESSAGRIRAIMDFNSADAKLKVPGIPLQQVVHAFYNSRIGDRKLDYQLRVRIRIRKGRLRLTFQDNLSPTSTDSLSTDLSELLFQNNLPSSCYRIRMRDESLQITFRMKRVRSSLRKSHSTPGNTKPIDTPLWISLSVIVMLYFLTRRLLSIFATAQTITSQELIHLSIGLLLCGISVFLVLLFGRKIKLKTPLSFIIHFVFSVLTAAVVITIEFFLRSPEQFELSWTYTFLIRPNVIRFPDQVLAYWGVLLLATAFWNFRSYTKEEMKHAQLQSDLSGAQLKALEMQLHPHFLFNTLHVINGLILTNQSVATRMLRRLQHFLQMTLESSDRHLVPLLEELKFLECYLDIQKVRFGKRLNIKMNVDPGVLDLPVPQLILQPIVENAIRHGLSGTLSGGEIFLQAHRQNGSLRIAVQDNGPGSILSPASGEQKKGVGLKNSALRLYHLYGDAQQFSFGNRPEGGFEVKMQIPVPAQAGWILPE
jgi:LytS/YehU family sensor histidine kinase